MLAALAVERSGRAARAVERSGLAPLASRGRVLVDFDFSTSRPLDLSTSRLLDLSTAG
jgi:hypothetical protein